MKLRKLGCLLTVERFGAQMAGFMHLRKLRPDYLKIDGRYTRNIHIEADNQLFVQSLLSIGQSLGIKVIAETVENIEESQWLNEIGIDGQQGFFIDKPVLV